MGVSDVVLLNPVADRRPVAGRYCRGECGLPGRRPVPLRRSAMIRLLFRGGWFWELAFWLLVLELARVIGG